jgi:FAD/FMN-containing dehydrogenase
MKFIEILTFGAMSTGSWASSFEPINFNVTEALLNTGVDVSAIPELSGLVERSSLSACSIAVCFSHSCSLVHHADHWQCNALTIAFGANNTLFGGSSAYDAFTGAYWAKQQVDVNPYCVFKPSKAVQVSASVLISRLTQCPFAVKGGGHAAFAGGSSIEGGITIALERMDEVTLSSDKKLVAVGPGNRWIKVYETLEHDGLAVIGGRIAGVGVSGLTLGGGISHFANAYGWACDNVDSFEVVTASGIIVTASAKSYPDLYWALRGGGNNFGIVTRFNFRTFVLNAMWGGARVYLDTEWDAVYTAYAKIARNAAQDTKQAQIVSFALQNAAKIAAVDLEYSTPTPWPAIFSDYLAIPAVQDTTGITNLTTQVRTLGAGTPEGIPETYWDRTYKLYVTFKYELYVRQTLTSYMYLQ